MSRSLSRRDFFVAGAGMTAACATLRSRPTATAVRVPLVYDERGGLFIDARLNGRGPFRFILDTGASESTVGPTFAARLGLAVTQGTDVEGSAGSVPAGQTEALVEVPGAGARRMRLVVYDFHSYDPQCVGILGYQLLHRGAFQIDYRGRELVWNRPPPAGAIAMVLDGHIPRVAARVNGVSLDLRIDTGATFPPSADAYMNVTQDQAARLGLAGKPVDVLTATGTGSATLELPVYRLASLSVAGRSLDRAFAIVQPRIGYFARPDAVGLLGNSVLDKLAPFFDYAAGVFGVGA